MSTQATESGINLKPFCGEGDAGQHWDAPFVIGDYRYATNGHVVVRIPSGGEESTKLRSRAILGVSRLNWPKRSPANDRLVTWPEIDWIFEYRAESLDEYDVDDEYYGWFPSRDRTPLGEQEISTRYHYQISLLPNVRYLPGEKWEPIYFRFDGGEGLLMPMKKD